jgi:mannan polymerase II complex MNN11 subunit
MLLGMVRQTSCGLQSQLTLRPGYQTFYTNASTYAHLTDVSPSSWSLIPAIRHALTLHPDIDFVWSLSPHALITNITLSLHDHIFSPLPSLMRKDIPVVPPDSVIHTFSHLKPSQAYLILTQDIDNLVHTSFLLRNTRTLPVANDQSRDTWTHYLLDAWFDPLYRAYAFQKAENHALEHIVQWHPTILAKVVVVDQRLMNSYNFQTSMITDPETNKIRNVDSMWQPGDLLVNLKGCTDADERDCEREMRSYFAKWLQEVERADGMKPSVQLKSTDYKFDAATKADTKENKKDSFHDPRIHI